VTAPTLIGCASLAIAGMLLVGAVATLWTVGSKLAKRVRS